MTQTQAKDVEAAAPPHGHAGAFGAALMVASAPWLIVPILLVPVDERLRLGAAFVALAASCAGLLRAVRHDAAIAAAARRIDTLTRRLRGEGERDLLVPLDSAVASLATQVAALDHRLAHRHPLTGLPTREPLLRTIAGDIARGDGGLLGIVEFGDVERMNAFDAGFAERALAAFAERVTRMVGAGRMVAHVDRARFAIWFGTSLAPAAARASLDAIGYALSDAISLDGRALLPEVRTGAAALPDDAREPAALLARAAAALAIDAGSDPVDPTLAARESFEIEQDLRQAVARDQLELRFQPLIDGVEGRVIGAEALVRWQHPERGLVQPALFVPVAEAVGLADELGLWTLNAACRAARGWQRSGLGPMLVAVNLSAHQLERADLQALVQRTLKRHGLAPSSLELELTEGVAAADTERTAAVFDALRGLGLRIAIDDFGTGYSSLSALKKLAFDKLKIDREFVTEVDLRPDSQAICQSLIALGRGLGIRVLAEGIERAEEYQWLRRHGCALFQGYYFAPPLTGEAFDRFVRDRSRLGALAGLSPVALQARLGEKLAG